MMVEKYVSEQLLKDISRPLLNFLWYLWETYCDAMESRFTLQSDGQSQQVTIHAAGKTITKDLGSNMNAGIVIYRFGADAYMTYDN